MIGRVRQTGRPVRRLARWQRATAIVPLALLSGAWTAALTTGGLATASSEQAFGERPDMPQVPTTPFQVPASVQVSDSLPSGIDPNAGPEGTLSTLSSNGIPTAAVLAYERAATVLEKADPSCGLEWPLVAAIGRVESDHGRYGGNVLTADGVADPGIYGVPLDGSSNTATIRDTDSGAYDNDQVWDRAVGPMQFIPSTWKLVGVDADGDGNKNPQDIDDASLATAVYLCAGSGDLGSEAGARAAVFRYNHSASYVDLVLSIAQAYTNGDYTMVPNDAPSPVVLTDIDNDYQEPRQGDGRDRKGHNPNPRQQTGPGGGGHQGGTGTSPGNGDGYGDGDGDGDIDGDANNPDGGSGNDGNGDGDIDDGDQDGNGGDGDGDGDANNPDGGNGGGDGDKDNDGDGDDKGNGGDDVDTGVGPVDDTTDPVEEATKYCQKEMDEAGLDADEIADNLDKCVDAYLDGGEKSAAAAIAGILKALDEILPSPDLP